MPAARENVTERRTRPKGFSGDCVRPNNIYVSTFSNLRNMEWKREKFALEGNFCLRTQKSFGRSFSTSKKVRSVNKQTLACISRAAFETRFLISNFHWKPFEAFLSAPKLLFIATAREWSEMSWRPSRWGTELLDTQKCRAHIRHKLNLLPLLQPSTFTIRSLFVECFKCFTNLM